MPIAVSLAGKDQIVDAPTVHAYLTGTGGGNLGWQEQASASAGAPSRWEQDGFEVLYYPELDHATVFDTLKDRAPLLEVLRRFVWQQQGEGNENDSDTVVASGGELVDAN